jgi:succinate dehydrogenase / fumarate reductase, cytochrome b subunit
MKNKHNAPSPSRFWMWFNPIGRKTGGWAFILNRITALGLTFYLYLHLIVLGQLAKGAAGYDGFVALMHNPYIIVGELLVVAAGIMHGLNGIRIILTTFGIGIRYQKTLFYIFMAIALIAILVFGIRMFTA